MSMLLRRHYQVQGEEETLPAPEEKPTEQAEELIEEKPRKRGRPRKEE